MTTSRWKTIAAYVKTHLYEQAKATDDPQYRWRHTLRVTGYGKQLAEAEGARVDIVVPACLLHDIAVFEEMEDRREHGRIGADLIKPKLLEWNYSEADTEAICYCVATHVDIPDVDTLEAKIISDADNIDRFGALRLIHWVQYGPDDYDELIANLQERVEQLKDYREKGVLYTKTGNKLFNQQLDRQILVFEAIIQESTLSVIP